MIRTLLFILVLCTAAIAQAQDLTYEYDFAAKKSIVHNDEGIDLQHRKDPPVVSLGHRVHVVVKNINGRLYTITGKASGREVIIANQNTDDLIGRINNLSSRQTSNRTAPAEAPTTKELIDDIATALNQKRRRLLSEPKARIDASQFSNEIKMLVDDYNGDGFFKNLRVAAKGIAVQQAQLSAINGVLYNIENTQAASLDAAKHAANDAISPITTITDSTYDYTSSLLRNISGMDDIIIKNVLNTQIEYVKFTNASQTLSALLDSFDMKPSDKLRIQLQFNSALSDSYATMYDTLMRQYSDYMSSRITIQNEIVNRYVAIFNTPYQFEFDVPAQGDMVDVELKIYRNRDDGTPSLDAAHLVTQKNYSVHVEGGWKVNVSSGIGVSSYLGQQKNFYNRGFYNGKPDSTIVGSRVSDFNPDLAFFVNAYPRSTGGVTFGYTLGIGFPVLSENKTPTVMLGGSILFGSEERLVMSLGVCGGSVNRLKNGFSEGQVLQSPTAEVPIEKGYVFGVFLGLSYNLTDFKLP